MKALPPGEGEAPSVDLGLSVALEGLNMAIGTLLTNPNEQHRYSEVMRLATIGKAVERQRARARKRVADFVPPGAIEDAARPGAPRFGGNENLGGQRAGRYGGGMACGPVGFRGEQGDIEDLGDEPVNAPGDREPGEGDANFGYGAPLGGAIYNQGPMGRIGAPYLGGGAGLGIEEPGLAGLVASMGGIFEGIAAARTEEGLSDRRLDRAKEIDSLTKAIERTDDPEKKKRLQALVDAATTALEDASEPKAPPGPVPAAPPPPPSAEADPLFGAPPQRPAWEGVPIVMPGRVEVHQEADPPRRLIACTQRGCGNRHADHWTTPGGEPLNCDVCNSPMEFIVDEPLPAAAAGNHAAQPQ